MQDLPIIHLHQDISYYYVMGASGLGFPLEDFSKDVPGRHGDIPKFRRMNVMIMRDNKKDRIFGVKAKTSDNGKVRFYCEMDETDYCPHTAFAAALPQVRNTIRR